MPFTEKGITPDLIINPNAIPSRMTLGHLLECVLGKVCALKGIEGDGTAFTNVDPEAIKDELEKIGYQRDGCEYLINGMTGLKMKAQIFIGPTYYQRLKHLVFDKCHCLSMDHEVLTEAGWKYFQQITMDDKIATLKDGCLAYDKPIKLLYYPEYNGKMYNIKSQSIDLNVTENHRMWVDDKLVTASDVMGKSVKYDIGLNAREYVEVNSGNCEETFTDEKCSVFCLQVPSEVFYVRRNGKGCWTGNSRRTGPRTLLLHQPSEGRARGGGMRIGEMERDALIAHGVARYIKEKLMDTSDIYTTFVCDYCGLFAQRIYKSDNKVYATDKDMYMCKSCNNSTNISKIVIPYAFKLLVQELMSMCIAPRIRVANDKYTM